MQLKRTALVIALGAIMAAPVYAQTSVYGGNGPSPYAGTGNTVGPTGDPGATSNGRATSGSGAAPMNRTGATTSPDPATRSPSVDNWASDYARAHQGRVSRQAYMDEMGRRWDAYDRSGQGLTPDQFSQLYGSPPLVGAERAGNMGPANQRGQ
jgi:hypothetical protein